MKSSSLLEDRRSIGGLHRRTVELIKVCFGLCILKNNLYGTRRPHARDFALCVNRLQGFATLMTQAIGAKQWVACQCGVEDDMLTKDRPFPFVLNAQDNGVTIFVAEWSVRINRRVGCSRPGGRRCAVVGVVHRNTHERAGRHGSLQVHAGYRAYLRPSIGRCSSASGRQASIRRAAV